jgi:hypothetical protein
MANAGIARFLDDYLHNLKDKRLELKRDEESYGNSLNEEDCGYLLEKYKANLDYFIQDLQAAVDRMPNAPAANAPAANAPVANAENIDPSNQSSVNRNNARNNPSGGRRKNKKTRRHRK